MDVGVIGSGNIGANAARLFARAGDPTRLGRGDRAERPGRDRPGGGGLRGGRDGGDPLRRYEDSPADRLEGKIFVSASNYYPARDGEIEHDGLASSELVQRHLPDARVVKAFNTSHSGRLRDNELPDAPLGEREVIFVSGRIEDIGFAPVDVGTLADSRRQESGSLIYNVAMTPDRAREMLAGFG